MTTAELHAMTETGPESSSAMEEPVGNLLPIVIVGDRSSSMFGEPIAVVNRELRAVSTGLLNHPIAGAITRLAVVSFADDARVDLDMAEIKDVYDRMPQLQADGCTGLAAVLDLLHTQIPQWCEDLRHPGEGRLNAVARPTVFLFTDGAPTDTEQVWRAALGRFTDLSNKWRPNIVAFGIGQADPTVIAALPQGHGAAFMSGRGDDVASNLGSIVKSILNSVIQTAGAVQVAAAAGAAGGQLPVPPPIPASVSGMTPLPLTVI